ncbi:MAG: transposase [Elusimicrobiota bacterium]|nr:transposase [Elusimicrobiota bacterium]
MPRNARLDIPGCLYHVIARGNERRNIFTDDADRYNFMSRLAVALRQNGSKCLAWCLMPNHFHLVILRGLRPLSELMRRLLTGYVGNFNRRHLRCGHLFQNRYKSILCEQDEYLLELVAYVHLNPLRARLVGKYEDLRRYNWCGHGEALGTARTALIDRDYVLDYYGHGDGDAAAKYEEFLRARINKYKTGELSGGGLLRSIGGAASLLSMRQTGEKEMSDSRVLGSGGFVEALLAQIEKETEPGESAEAVLERVCAETGATAAEIKSRSRIRRIVEARARYCYMAEMAGVSGGLLAEELGRNSGSISYLVGKGRELEENNRVIV